MSEKMMFCWRNVFSRVVNTAFHMFSREKVWEKRVFLQKKYVWHSFLLLNEEIPDLWQKFSTRVSKTKSTWPEELFGKTLFGGRYNFMSFDGCSEENLICKKTQGSSLGHSTRRVEHSKGRNSGRNKSFLTFGQWARLFWVSGTTKLPELPKLHSMWLEQLLDWIELFFKKNALLIFLPILAKNFNILWKRIRQRYQVRTLRLHINFKKKLDEPGRLCTCPAEPNIFGEKIWQSPKLFDLWATSEKKDVLLAKCF